MFVVAGRSLRLTPRSCCQDRDLKSDETIHSALARGGVGVAVTSPTKGFVEVNDELCRILGRSRAAIRAMTWPDLTHPADLPADLTQFNRLLAGETHGYALDKRFIRDDGEVVWATIAVQCLRASNGAVEGVLGVAQAVSEVEGASRQPRTGRGNDLPDWIAASTPEDRAVLTARRKGFRPNHVPRWFRARLTASNATFEWGLSTGHVSGWRLLQEYRLKFPAEGGLFEGCGVFGDAFVSQPKLPMGAAVALATTTADMLGVVARVDDLAPSGPTSVWVEWRPARK